MNNDETRIEIEADIASTMKNVWDCWVQPQHVMGWNFAASDWHCPQATSEFRIGGEFHYLMAAKDGSFSFDFWGVFHDIEDHVNIEITLGDGRKMSVLFHEIDQNQIKVTEIFEPETENPVEMQRAGWQMILNNFKDYAERLGGVNGTEI